LFFCSPQLHWLHWGYSVEFLTRPSFLSMWLAGVGFFLANVTLLAVVLTKHRFRPVFVRGRCTSIEEERP
jgi:hypothetical protein